MILPKETRRRLYAKEIVEVRLPEPLALDRPYAIQADRFRSAKGHFRVVSQKRDGDEWVARLKFDGDPVRLLAKGAGDNRTGYTSKRSQALEDEPEAVDEATQRRFNTEARSRFEEAQRQEHDEDQRKAQERSFRAKLSETMSGLRPEARAALLAELERALQQAGSAEAA